MFKQIKKIAFSLGAVLLLTNATAALAADATGGASVTIAQPLQVTEETALSFGVVSPSASAGTVVITTAGARSVTGGVGELGGSPAAASFSVDGEGNTAYSISLPSTATLTGTGADMSVSAFNHDAGGSPALSSGEATFNVGATLAVGASQAPGLYSGNYTVTINYN